MIKIELLLCQFLDKSCISIQEEKNQEVSHAWGFPHACSGTRYIGRGAPERWGPKASPATLHVGGVRPGASESAFLTTLGEPLIWALVFPSVKQWGWEQMGLKLPGGVLLCSPIRLTCVDFRVGSDRSKAHQQIFIEYLLYSRNCIGQIIELEGVKYGLALKTVCILGRGDLSTDSIVIKSNNYHKIRYCESSLAEINF